MTRHRARWSMEELRQRYPAEAAKLDAEPRCPLEPSRNPSGTQVEPARKPWSAAKRTPCRAGHIHASGLEATVCERLTAECKADGLWLVQQVAMPLLLLRDPKTGRCPRPLRVDFAVYSPSAGKLVRLVDAKGRRSRDWPARRRACEVSWGVPIEEIRA